MENTFKDFEEKFGLSFSEPSDLPNEKPEQVLVCDWDGTIMTDLTDEEGQK